MSTTQKPEALRLADKYEIEGFLQDHRFAQDHWCRQAAAELRRQHARIAELEAQLSAIGAGGVEPLRKSASQQEAPHHAEGVPEQAGTYAEARECEHCNHVGINDSAEGVATCVACQWIGDSPKEDKCPNCEAEGTMTASCPKCHHEYRLIADAELAATPAAVDMGIPMSESDAPVGLPESVLSGMKLVNAGALQMVVNALRRDAEEGKVVRGEMADELLATGGQAQAVENDLHGAVMNLQVSKDAIEPFDINRRIAYKMGHRDARHAAAELIALHAPQQADARDVERWMGIGKAIERACRDLPDNTEIIVYLEKGAGTVTLIDQDGNEHENFSTDYGFAGVLNEAIDTAIAPQAKQGDQP